MFLALLLATATRIASLLPHAVVRHLEGDHLPGLQGIMPAGDVYEAAMQVYHDGQPELFSVFRYLGIRDELAAEIEAHYDAATHVCNLAIDTHERGEVQLRSEFAEQPLAGTNNNYQVAIRQVPQPSSATPRRDGNRSCNHVNCDRSHRHN